MWAPTTWRTKGSQWKKYLSFCSDTALVPVPTDTTMMCRFVVSLRGGLQFATIDNYVSGVLALNKLYGHNCDYIRSDFVFKSTMGGLKRIIGDPEPLRPTLSITDLLLMFLHVQLKDPSCHSMWACIALAFRALLRKSNLVPASLTTPGMHYLRRGAVCFTTWGLSIAISSSKTIQYQQRTHCIPVTSASGSPLCAVDLVREHFRNFPKSDPASPAFWIISGSKQVPLTYPKLLSFIKFLLKKIGKDCPGAGMHCLRRAGAAYMYSLGLSLDDVRQAGDWKSLAALIYLTKPLSGRVVTDRIVSETLKLF